MSYQNTVDEKISGYKTYPAGYLDAANSIFGAIGQLAEGFLNKAYGALIRDGYLADHDMNRPGFRGGWLA